MKSNAEFLEGQLLPASEETIDFSGIDAGDLRRLHSLSLRLFRDLPLPELLDDVLRASMELLDAAMGNVQLFNAKENVLEIVSHAGMNREFLDFFSKVDHEVGACGAAMSRGHRVVVEDVENDPIFRNLLPITRAAGYRAVQSTPLRGSKGQLLGILSTHFKAPHCPTAMELRLLDLYAQQAERVIERKQAEEALRAKERQLRLVTDTVPIVIAHLDSASRYKFVNKGFAERFNKPPEYFTGKSIAEVFGEETAAKARPMIERAMRGEKFEVTTEFNYDQWGRRVMRAVWTPEFDAQGVVIGCVAAARDVTEKIRLEERFQFVVENSTEFIGMCDLAGRPLFVNDTALRMVGLKDLAALQAVEVKDFFFPEDQSFIVRHFLPRVLRDGHGTLEVRFRHFQTGEAIWMNYNVVTIKEAGQPVGFATISQNINERKRTEHQLRESEIRIRTLVESLPQLVWTCRPDGYCDYLSPQWIAYTGIPQEQHHGIGWTNAVHPDDFERVKAVWLDAVSAGKDYRVEYRLRRQDGEYHWFTAIGLPVRNGSGNIVRWFGSNTDMDERRRAEEQLRESQERLSAALNASSTGTFRWNIQTNELDWDDELDRLFGLTPGESARSLAQFIERVHPEDRAMVIAACERCVQDGADFHEEFRVVWPDNSTHWVDDKGKTFFDATGKPLYMTGACIDITARKRAEHDLRDAQQKLSQHAEELEHTVRHRSRKPSRRWRSFHTACPMICGRRFAR